MLRLIVNRAIFALFLTLIVFFAGCASKSRQAPHEGEVSTAQKNIDRQSSVALRPTLAAGKLVWCGALFDDASVSSELGLNVTTTVSTDVVPGASAVCSFSVTSPETAKDARALRREHKLKTGDEYCQVQVFCSGIYSAEREAARCVESGGTVRNEAEGTLCLKSFRRNRHSVSLLDADSRCRLEILEGLSVFGEGPVLACAKAARAELGPEKLHRTEPVAVR